MKINSNKILLFNPRSGQGKHRLPNSILQIAASVLVRYEVVIVDGNREKDPFDKIENYLKSGEIKYFACTVMPGPQLKQAIPFTRLIKQNYPEIITVWGGYFPSNHYEVTMKSSIVDFIIYGQGDISFPQLIECLENGDANGLAKIHNLIYLNNRNEIVKNPANCISDLDNLPAISYDHLSNFYSIGKYISKTFMGNKTFSYHSSFGCPFHCSFCGVVNMFDSKWKGKSAKKMFEEIQLFKNKYGINAIEFHDNNFFASRERVMEFCRYINGMNIRWWAEGRIDSINKFSDDELRLLKDAGCCMIFMGAESTNDAVLRRINKGGTQKATDILELTSRLKKHSIVPEFSFVLGFPADNFKEMKDIINNELHSIREIKKLNPHAEIIIYIYSPVPAIGSPLFESLNSQGFNFPAILDDWLKPEWENFDLRKNPNTPWLNKSVIQNIKNFETVLNAAFPTVSDFKIRGLKKIILRIPAKLRYWLQFYAFPYELKLLLKIFRYRQAEKEGFYSE
jgi:anaerobic magnesium-protoporphyrin IX monomethyl ester cyclase